MEYDFNLVPAESVNDVLRADPDGGWTLHTIQHLATTNLVAITLQRAKRED